MYQHETSVALPNWRDRTKTWWQSLFTEYCIWLCGRNPTTN